MGGRTTTIKDNRLKRKPRAAESINAAEIASGIDALRPSKLRERAKQGLYFEERPKKKMK